MKLTFIEPHVDVISSYKNFAGESIFFEDVISSQYIYIKTTEVGFEKIRLIVEECVNGVHFLAVPGFMEMEYVVAIPKDVIAYLTSEALSYDMVAYLDAEGHEAKFPNIFYKLAYCDEACLFDHSLLNTHIMSDVKFIVENLDDIKYEIKTEDELCLENENMRVHVHMMSIRVTSTNSALKLFLSAFKQNDIFETLSAKSQLRECTCFMSDYFARDYSLVNERVLREVFEKWKNITQCQYDLVKLAGGDFRETDPRIYPPTHAVQQTYFVNLSMMINYIKMVFDVKYACDFFAIAVACDLVRILKNYQHVNEVATFFNQYNYLIEQNTQKMQAYHIAYREYTH